MMRRVNRWSPKIGTKRVFAALGFTVAAVAVIASGKVDWVLTPKHAIVVLPAVLVTDGSVEHASWAPDGAYLMVGSYQTSRPTIDQILNTSPGQNLNQSPVTRSGPSLFIWDRAQQQVKRIWSTDDPTVSIVNVTWLTGSPTAYVTMYAQGVVNGKPDFYCGVMAVSADTGRFSWVPGMEHLPQMPEIFASPLHPTAVAIFDDRTQEQERQVTASGDVAVAAVAGPPPAVPVQTFQTVPVIGEWIGIGADNFWTLGPNGQVTKRVQTQPSHAANLTWNKDGTKWYLVRRDRATKANVFQELGDTGNLTTVANVEAYVAPKEKFPELAINSKPMVAKQRKVKHGFSNVWLSSPETTFHPDVLLTPNGVQTQLSPTGDAVFFVEGGIAKVRALVALSDDQKKNLFAALKADALSNAKQVGLGLLMYSMDSDDILPPGDSFDQVDPYLKNRDMMDSFNYTPPGDLGTGHMQNPASTPLGYVDGPGGRAVVYGDGHVGWVANP